MSEIKDSHSITSIGTGVAKAIMHTNPITSFIQTVYDECIYCQWQQRREKWEEVLEEKLQSIKDEIDIIQIKSIPNFAQILANAGQGAMSDMEEDKVDFYANAVINSIRNENIDSTKKHIFLNMLREYSLAHIETLMYFDNPQKNSVFMTKYNIHGAIRYYSTEKKAFNDTCLSYKENEVEHIVIRELNRDLLIEAPIVDDVTLNWSVMTQSITTPIGKQFLSFIYEHEKTDN